MRAATRIPRTPAAPSQPAHRVSDLDHHPHPQPSSPGVQLARASVSAHRDSRPEAPPLSAPPPILRAPAPLGTSPPRAALPCRGDTFSNRSAPMAACGTWISDQAEPHYHRPPGCQRPSGSPRISPSMATPPGEASEPGSGSDCAKPGVPASESLRRGRSSWRIHSGACSTGAEGSVNSSPWRSLHRGRPARSPADAGRRSQCQSGIASLGHSPGPPRGIAHHRGHC
jgi:hypothetical protein